MELYNEDFCAYKDFNHIHPKNIKTYNFDECNCANKYIINSYFNAPRFFERLDFIDDYVEESIRLFLKNGFNISIVSHGFSPNLKLKEKWIEDYIQTLCDSESLGKVEFIGVNRKKESDKSCVDMSDGIFVDDNVGNLITSNARHKIIFGKTYPWNEGDHGYTRCENWYDLYNYVIEYSENTLSNEEWFCGLPTRDKALFMAAQGKYNTPEIMQMMLQSTAETIEKWLKEEYREE